MISIQPSIDYSLVVLDTTELDHILESSSTRSFIDTPSASPLTSVPSPTQSDLLPAVRSRSRSRSSSPVCTTQASRRRVRPKIDLAPGQPSTKRGNPRIRVFVACYQCRARKTRCDGAKPVCLNCQKRPSEVEQCNYDSGPHRRGPERSSTRKRTSQQGSTATTPLTRRRSGGRSHVGRTKPREDANANVQAPEEEGSTAQAQEPLPEHDCFQFTDAMMWDLDVMNSGPLLYDYDATMSTDNSQLQILGFLEDADQEEQEQSIPPRPGTQFARETWWDALLTFYATERDPGDVDIVVISLSLAQRSTALNTIITDLKALLQASPCWVGFLHLPRFFNTLFDPARRSSLQPSLLLSALALGAFVQSSHAENGPRGREKALKLLELAHGALDGALATGWVDIGLAQAALLIVYFEMQSHPLQSVARSRSAILLLDSLMRLFSLATVDEGIKPRGHSPFTRARSTATHAGNPAAQSSFFSPQMAPNDHRGAAQAPAGPDLGVTIAASLSSSSPDGGSSSSSSSSPASSHGCNCHALSLGTRWPSMLEFSPAFGASTLRWPEGLAEGDFRREESRRLVWASVMVIGNLHAYIAAFPGATAIDSGSLLVREPENFALMLPGEALAAAGATVEPDDMWTLAMRTMLLLHVCMRVRESKGVEQAERAHVGVQAWLEIDDLERRLARHTCNLDASFGYQVKELLFHMRMLASHEFRNFVPEVTTTGSKLFYRDKAEEWLRYVDECDSWVWKTFSMQTKSPSRDPNRKSALIFWFIANIRRALTLWENDHELMYGLELSKRFAKHAEYLMLFWPNISLHEVWQAVRMKLVEACLQAGIPPPSTDFPRIPPTAA
ncbi:hypothetical protein K466DRAFT_666667 [Polyporus arcularius HHB13444]|uniref:Zn(2)-C6 fungal-type domain-containing protein n=1 Tax=Polyporus arcularius HHB13444 TaxID=1314778 RepID=A0A5C3NY72_9APHY|nr:hypothetical protein K466DRAFT_666667 [Polyporus arcularius HHB13444]